MSDQNLSFTGHKMMGEYRAQVVSTQDPRRHMRVQVRVPGLWDAVSDRDLPWAEYRLAASRANGGSFEPAEVDDWVWVDFPNGDTRYPRITGWCHFAPGGKPNLPHEAWQGDDAIQHKTAEGEPTPVAPAYHGSHVVTKHGVTIEINPSGEYMVTQRASGTGVRITRDGSITVHCEADAFRSSAGDTQELVGGAMLTRVGNDAAIETGGNLTLKVGGNLILDVQGIIDETSAGHPMKKR